MKLSNLYIFSLVLFVLFAGSCKDDEEDIPNEYPDIENFVKENNLADGKVENGLFKKTIENGSGLEINDTSIVEVYYKGYLLDGTIFDENVSGVPFRYLAGFNQVITGWEKVLTGAKEGDSIQFVMHSKFAYGKMGSGAIDRYTPIAFDIKVVEVYKDEEHKMQKYLDKQKIGPKKAIEENIYLLRIIDLGKTKIEIGDSVEFTYTGQLLNGFLFTEENATHKYKVGDGTVINGWELALPHLALGDSARIIMHSDYGYGSAFMGDVLSFTPMIFNISIKDVIKND